MRQFKFFCAGSPNALEVQSHDWICEMKNKDPMFDVIRGDFEVTPNGSCALMITYNGSLNLPHEDDLS